MDAYEHHLPVLYHVDAGALLHEVNPNWPESAAKYAGKLLLEKRAALEEQFRLLSARTRVARVPENTADEREELLVDSLRQSAAFADTQHFAADFEPAPAIQQLPVGTDRATGKEVAIVMPGSSVRAHAFFHLRGFAASAFDALVASLNAVVASKNDSSRFFIVLALRARARPKETALALARFDYLASGAAGSVWAVTLAYVRPPPAAFPTHVPPFVVKYVACSRDKKKTMRAEELAVAIKCTRLALEGKPHLPLLPYYRGCAMSMERGNGTVGAGCSDWVMGSDRARFYCAMLQTLTALFVFHTYVCMHRDAHLSNFLYYAQKQGGHFAYRFVDAETRHASTLRLPNLGFYVCIADFDHVNRETNYHSYVYDYFRLFSGHAGFERSARSAKYLRQDEKEAIARDCRAIQTELAEMTGCGCGGSGTCQQCIEAGQRDWDQPWVERLHPRKRNNLQSTAAVYFALLPRIVRSSGIDWDAAAAAEPCLHTYDIQYSGAKTNPDRAFRVVEASPAYHDRAPVRPVPDP